MSISEKISEQAADEIARLRRRIAELESAEAERQKSEEKFRTLADFTYDWEYWTNPEGNFFYVSPSCQRISGYHAEEFIKDPGLMAKIAHPDDRAAVAEHMAAAITKRDTCTLEFRIITRGGKERWIEHSCQPIYDGAGKYMGQRASNRDVTERRERDEELRRSEEKYRSLVSNIPDVVWTSAEDYGMAFVGPNVERITGYTQEEEYRCSNWLKWFDRLHPDDARKTKAAFRKFVKVGKPYDIEYRFKRKDGSWVWINERSVGTYIKDGKKYADGLLSDITERKQAEEEIRRSEEKYRSLVSNIPDIVWTSDENCNIVYVGTNVERLTGYNQEEEYRLGNWIKWFGRLHPEDMEKAKTSLWGFIKGKQPYDVEYRFKRKDGKWIWIHDRSLGTYIKDGKKYADGLLSDITEQKRIEESRIEQAAALAKAKAIQQSRQRIIAMQESVRKDIALQLHGTVQNRLIVIMHRLLDLEQTSPSSEMTAEIADLHQKLEDVVENHIRPVSHQLFPSILRRGLVPALQSLGDEFAVTPSTIKTELSEPLERKERGNPRFVPEQVRLAIYRIAQEALINAVKHSKASHVTLRLGLLYPGWLRLKVQDDGRGWNLKKSDPGQGMLMMQDYAEVAGGSCSFKSARGKGTEVVAEVPFIHA